MFWVKSKTINLDCFINSETINATVPIKKAAEFAPDWWKNLPKYVVSTRKLEGTNIDVATKSPTMRSCYGLVELYRKGFIIPLWSDLEIHLQKDYFTYQFGCSSSSMGAHDTRQFTGHFTDYHVIKINSPWIIREKTGVNFLFAEPFWNKIKVMPDVCVPYGVLEFKNQCYTNINLVLKREEKEIKLKVGTPMAHVIPLSESDIKIKTHVLTEPEYNKMYTFGKRNTIMNFMYRTRAVTLK